MHNDFWSATRAHFSLAAGYKILYISLGLVYRFHVLLEQKLLQELLLFLCVHHLDVKTMGAIRFFVTRLATSVASGRKGSLPLCCINAHWNGIT